MEGADGDEVMVVLGVLACNVGDKWTTYEGVSFLGMEVESPIRVVVGKEIQTVELGLHQFGVPNQLEILCTVGIGEEKVGGKMLGQRED
jgi:hypothetical protein